MYSYYKDTNKAQLRRFSRNRTKNAFYAGWKQKRVLKYREQHISLVYYSKRVDLPEIKPKTRLVRDGNRNMFINAGISTHQLYIIRRKSIFQKSNQERVLCGIETETCFEVPAHSGILFEENRINDVSLYKFVGMW